MRRMSVEQIDATAATIRSDTALLPALRWRIAEIESDLASMSFADETSGLRQFHPDKTSETTQVE